MCRYYFKTVQGQLSHNSSHQNATSYPLYVNKLLHVNSNNMNTKDYSALDQLKLTSSKEINKKVKIYMSFKGHSTASCY